MVLTDISWSVAVDNGEVRCYQSGEGPVLLIAVHGYGDRGRLFSPWYSCLDSKYTLVSFDLPWHGQTEWRGRVFTPDDLIQIFEKIREQTGHERFVLVGYSFGARLSMQILPALMHCLDGVIWVAPDGVQTRGMDLAVATPMWARRFLYQWLEHPEWMLRLIGLGARLGWVPQPISHFLSTQLVRADRRERVFGCWFALQYFRVKKSKIRSVVAGSGLPFLIFLGERDRFIKSQKIKKWFSPLPGVQIVSVQGGHRIVNAETGGWLQRLEWSDTAALQPKT